MREFLSGALEKTGDFAKAIAEFTSRFCSEEAWHEFVHDVMCYLIIAIILFVCINTLFDAVRRAIRGLDVSLIGGALAFAGYKLKDVPLLKVFSDPFLKIGLILVLLGIGLFIFFKIAAKAKKKIKNEAVSLKEKKDEVLSEEEPIKIEKAKGKVQKNKIKIIIAVILAFVMGICSGMLIDFKADSDSGNATVESIEGELNDKLELTVKEYSYTQTVKLDPQSLKIKGYDIPFTEKEATVKFEGKANLGPDMDKAKIRVNEITNHIVIKLPHSSILSNEIDEDSFTILDESNGLFNRLKLSDATTVRVKGKEAVEEKIKEEGMLDEADEEAEKKISEYIEKAYPEYKVNVKYTDEED